MTIYRARWVLPIDVPSIPHGWVAIDEGRITGVGGGRPPGPAEDLGHVVVLPALVNAHTHLELSWLADLVPPASSMAEWIRGVLRFRAHPPGDETARQIAMRRAAEEMYATGTRLVGDVSNTLTSARVLVEAGLGGVLFHELLGFGLAGAAADQAVAEAWAAVDHLRPDLHRRGPSARPLDVSVVAHAPYSCSADLMTRIAAARRAAPIAIHLAESIEELELLRSGGGPFRSLLQDAGVWAREWIVPECDPVTYMHRVGYLQPGLLAVHGVHLRDPEFERLRDAGAILVTCPRSNEWVGAGLPPVARAYATGVPVAIGTDSLASVGSLNLFDELAALRRIAPEVTAASFLESATRVGAAALGFEAEFGTIAPGKRAELLAVEVPRGVTDVEEYLVGGVPPASLRPLSADSHA